MRISFAFIMHVKSIQAAVLVGCLKDCMLHLNIKTDIYNCRPQCCDNAANMCRVRSDVSTQICKEEQQAIFVHCDGHALNLAAGDAVKSNNVLRNALDNTFEISKLLKFSAPREGIFNKIKAELSPDTAGFRTSCPTRWTVRASSFDSVLSNFEVLMSM